MLASELGLAPAPPAITPPAIAPPTSVAAPPSSPPEQSRRGATPPEAPEESPNFFDERFDFEEPFDLLESSESPAATAEATAEATEPTEKRPHKRRRRRRRGRGGEQREPREAGASAAADDRSADLASNSAKDSDREFVADGGEAVGPRRAHEEAETGESENHRSKRRRPRRGRNRRDTETGAAAAGELPDARTHSSPVKSHEVDAVEADVLADDDIDLGEGDDAERPARLGFRGIPTWEEAVGLLIDKNLEARAKRPAGGPHHGRGNRGPRDKRGGRGGKRGS